MTRAEYVFEKVGEAFNEKRVLKKVSPEDRLQILNALSEDVEGLSKYQRDRKFRGLAGILGGAALGHVISAKTGIPFGLLGGGIAGNFAGKASVDQSVVDKANAKLIRMGYRYSPRNGRIYPIE